MLTNTLHSLLFFKTHKYTHSSHVYMYVVCIHTHFHSLSVYLSLLLYFVLNATFVRSHFKMESNNTLLLATFRIIFIFSMQHFVSCIFLRISFRPINKLLYFVVLVVILFHQCFFLSLY